MLVRSVYRNAATIAVVCLGLAAFAKESPAGEADGNWARDDGLIRTHIAACGEETCATNIWAKDPQGEEKVGDKLIMKLKTVDPGHMTGTAFDPQRNRTYSLQLNVAGDRLTTRGCILAGIVCRSVGWTRMTP